MPVAVGSCRPSRRSSGPTGARSSAMALGSNGSFRKPLETMSRSQITHCNQREAFMASFHGHRALVWMFLVGWTLGLGGGPLAFGDVVELRDGGVIVGKVVNPQQGQIVKIETEEGATIEVDRKLVKIRLTLDRDLEYAKKLASRSDSLEDHRAVVEECMSQQMVSLANAHRERIVELDPSDRSAWENLRYYKDDVTGKWVRREVVMHRRGKIKGDKGRWFTWEEKALLDFDQKVKLQRVAAEKELDARLKGLKGNSRQQSESQAYFQTLNNPLLIGKLATLLREDRSDDRRFYLELLKQMPIHAVTPALVRVALEDRDINVVNAVLDFLGTGDERVREMAVSGFSLNLSSKSKRDRAAYCMTPFNDERFIGLLIGSLLSSDLVRPAGPPGSTNAGFSTNGGISFANGAPPPTERLNQHKDVLASLTQLTNENFGYDILEWRKWFARTYAYENMDLRRDEN